MGSVYPYGQLVRAVRTGVSFVPRRTLASTAIRRAQEDGNDNSTPSPKLSESKKSPSLFSSVKDYFLGGKPKEKATVAHTPTAPKKEEGGLGSSSIFADDLMKGPKPSRKKEPQPGEEVEPVPLEERNKTNLQMALNPLPKSQLRWERKMVIREVRKRGRIPRPVQIKRTERESLSKSHWFKTSVKKLAPLARQIAGKNLDEAILQMRFSKKKAAQDVLGHLEHAKNVAMVRAGMGLPGPQGSEQSKPMEPMTVILKDGSRKKITDPTSIYIQQAWVNRGPYGYGMDHRARGQINRLRPPATGLTVLLKEEKTRIREWQEREAKALRQRKAQLWHQLPDRKITAQNQYYSW
ncbi:Ribosomal protein L22 bacterial/chloroplast-type [Penicillium alfredii]|uniref:Ribosomal protein L22 bacterial/chloroplast-type n=1 Tax=Penicillium alfredii TaxID=1506179 RepID=A0A9W9GBS3_9EURO|nr:mitochondrial 54S ribosomal protein L22 [Penicillium alfredii]KAJ5115130.1 Ribosomal protein L22 bacterial/chloroplast-type [Penicillium alfredii]